MIVTFANVKGGSGKTTSAMHVAAVLAARDRRVVLIDADGQASARRWHRSAAQLGEPLPFALEFLPTADLVNDIDHLAEVNDDVVIDVGPANADIMLAAVAVADLVVIPVNAREDDRQQAKKTHDDCTRLEIPHAVLLNRVRGQETTSIAITREFCAEHGIPVLATVVPDLVSFGDAFGTGIAEPGQYAQVVDELEALHGKPA